jgi:hypothetical protein
VNYKIITSAIGHSCTLLPDFSVFCRLCTFLPLSVIYVHSWRFLYSFLCEILFNPENQVSYDGKVWAEAKPDEGATFFFLMTSK